MSYRYSKEPREIIKIAKKANMIMADMVDNSIKVKVTKKDFISQMAKRLNERLTQPVSFDTNTGVLFI